MLTKFILILSAIASIGSVAVANPYRFYRSTDAVAIAQSPASEINQIARAITVQVYAGDDRGSGILIAHQDNTYTVVTNAHVSDRGDTYKIKTADGIEHKATIGNSDGSATGNDLAILQFDSTNTYQIAKLANSGSITEGETVTAAGFPYDRHDLLITQGKISLLLKKSLAKGYQIGFSNETIQGMSGGVLINNKGEAIGVLGKGKGALLDDAYNYQDGTTPNAEVVEQMKDSSFSVPIANIAQLSPQLASLLPGKNNPTVAQATPETAPKPELVGYAAEVDRIAEQITVRIDNLDNNSNGSGVIIAKQGNTYYGLTAKHVVCQEPISKPVCEANGTHQIVTADGTTHQLDYQNVEANQAWLDMAIFSFESSNNYEVATIGKYQTTKDFHFVFVSGFPGKDKLTETKSTRLMTGGVVFPERGEDFFVKESASLSKAKGIGQDGLLYTNISHRGMSGGAVLDAEGRLIGINTGSEQELYFDNEGNYAEFNIGFSLGESIIDLFGYLQANKTQLQMAWLNVVEDSSPLPINAETKNAEFEEKERIAQYLQLWRSTIEKPRNETDLAAWMNYGSHLQRQLKYDEAIGAFEKVIAIDPHFDKAYYAIARTYLLTGKWQQIADIMTQATQINPNPYYYWRLLGRAYQFTEQYDRSLVAYEEAIAKNQSEGSKDFTLYVERAGVLAKSKQYNRALIAYEQATKTNPNHPSAYNNRCHVYSLLEQYEKAIADCRKVTEINPQNDDAYFKLASIYRSLKEYDQVITVSSKALEINPQRDDIYVARGNAYLRLQQYEQAITDNDKAIEINSKNYNAYNVRGIANENLKKYDKAIADYGKAIDINSKNDVIYANRGSVYLKLEQYEQAISDYNKAIEINPQSALFYNNRGSAYHSLKQYEQAASDYNLARKIDPKSYVALKNLSLIDYENNGTIQPQILLAASTIAIGNSVDLIKNNSVGLNKLAEITLILALHEQASDNTEKSLQLAKTALQTAPELKDAQFLRENLWGDKAIADIEKIFAQL